MKQLVRLSLFLAMSIVLSIVESLWFTFIPGVKLGLANLIVVICLYDESPRIAFILLISRVILVGLLLGTFFSPVFFLSLGGALTSFIIMISFKAVKVFNIISVSMMGAVGHSLGQIFVAMILLETALVIYYLPFILALSVLAGIFIGITARRSLRFLNEK